MSLAPPSPSLPDRLALIIAALCGALAVRCARDRATAPIGLLLWRRLHRATKRFQTLFALWREGRLPPPNPRPKRARTTTSPVPRLPGGFAWVVTIMPEAAAYGTQLQQFLADPELSALLAEAPQAARIFRPLCRMLGVRPLPESLRPPQPAPPAEMAARKGPAWPIQEPLTGLKPTPQDAVPRPLFPATA